MTKCDSKKSPEGKGDPRGDPKAGGIGPVEGIPRGPSQDESVPGAAINQPTNLRFKEESDAIP
jgi:hypothetical protein